MADFTINFEKIEAFLRLKAISDAEHPSGCYCEACFCPPSHEEAWSDFLI